MTDIQQALLELVTLNTDFTQLIKETEENGSRDGEVQTSAPAYTEGLLHTVEHQIMRSAHTETAEVVAASLLAKQLGQVLACDAGGLLLTEQSRRNVSVFMESVQHLQQKACFSQHHFVKLINFEGPLPLELIWLFHHHDVMRLDAYITCHLSRPAAIGRLGQDVANAGIGTEGLDRKAEIVGGLMSVLLQYGYTSTVETDNSSTRGLKKVSCVLLDSITKKSLLADCDLSVYAFLRHISPTDEQRESVKRYTSRQLSIILSANPQYKVSDALHQQPQWNLAKTDPCRVESYRELLGVFSAAESLKILKNVLEEQEVNWRSVLSFTTVLLTCFSEVSTLLQGLCRDLIGRALEQNELDGLITGFLLARQGALEGPHVFPTYQNWFYGLFGEPHVTPATNKKTFGFLIKFMADIVPFESVNHLKAHIVKPPFVPAKCRPLLSDYLALAKTRLKDLGHSLEDSSIFSKAAGTSGTDGTSEKILSDVEAAVESFRKSGKIPASVMEASIFRKPYFVGRFLPCLLKPRPLPDAPDVRMRLIESLSCAEKIPKSLYTVYRRECERLTTQLLEGLFSDEEEDMQDLTLSPWQQLQKCLEALQTAVIAAHTCPSAPTLCPASVPAQLSLLYAKCCQLLHTEGAEDEIHPGFESVNTQQLGLKRQDLKVIDAILQSVGETLEALTSYSHLQHSWLKQLIAVVTRNTEMCRTLHVRVLELISEQGRALSRSQVSVVSALCVHIVSDPDLPKVKVNERSFIEAVSAALKLSDRQWVTFTFRFLTEYLVYALRAYLSVCLHPAKDGRAAVPLGWCQRFQFLHQRLSFSSSLHHMTVTMETADSLAQSAQLQHLWQAEKLSFTDWLKLELSVNVQDDLLCLNRRQAYCEEKLFTEFVSSLKSESQTEQHWSLQLCTDMALVFVHTDSGSESNGFCRCNKMEDKATTSFSQFRPDLTCLLQRLVHFFPSSPRHSGWLVDLFHRVRQQCEGEGQRDALVGRLLCLSDLLPPYLLMMNSPEAEKGNGLPALVEFINCVWLHHDTSGCLLSGSRTFYLAQAMHSTQHLSSDWLTVAKECPLVTASLQYYWSAVCIFFEDTSLVEIIQPIRCIHTLCNRSVGEAGNLEVSRSEGSADPLLTSMALLALVKRNGNSSVSIDQLVTMATYRSCTPWLVRAILCSLSWETLYNKPLDGRLSELLVTMVVTRPTCVDLQNSPHVLTRLCRENIPKLWPLVLLKAFQKATSDTSQACESVTCVSLLLQCFIQCTGLYHTGVQNTGPLTALCDHIQPLSLEFLLHSSDWLKQLLTATSTTVRRDLDRSVVEQCDPDIRSLCYS